MIPRRDAPLDRNAATLAARAWRKVRADVFPDQYRTLDTEIWHQFAPYINDPVGFCTDVMGERLWAGERAILEAARDNPLVAIRSCRKAGKTHTLALLIIWFVCTRQAVVICIATKQDQLKTQLWSYIAERHARSKTKLPGQVDTLQWKIGPRHFAHGIAAGEETGMRGFHGGTVVPENPDQNLTEDEYKRLVAEAELAGEAGAELLIVIDEAPGVDDEIFQAFVGALQGRAKCVIAGNPLMDPDAAHEFARAHTRRAGATWFRIHFQALAPTNPKDTDPVDADAVYTVPNWLVRDQWIAERKRAWGENNPLYYADVLGRFSSASLETQIIPPRIIRAAEVFTIYDPGKVRARHIGCDLGRSQNGDPSVAQLWINGQLCAVDEWHSDDTTVSAARIRILMREWAPEGKQIPAENVHLDALSFGGGVYDQLKQQGFYTDGVDFGGEMVGDWVELCGDTLFLNRKTELFWVLRRALEEGLAKIPARYEETRIQLPWHTYKFKERASGTVMCMGEPKDELRARYGRSPDHADAAVYAWSRSSARPLFAVADIGDLSSLKARLLGGGSTDED